ncbi:DUF484 family protein [Brevundimonas naejangsanensis]|uniref:DUF484 family protein n=1 Tax=Brevundimonas naejangsanensis TaxID=588932 RepID=A0A494RDP1_9CAUL|nr:DUF484 family protein [Brevundimonas naejangsanensis]AYG94425.1 DUF484 family protein [Brevundimonas naejangsanensis]
MSTSLDLSSDPAASSLHWPEVRAWLGAHADFLLDDRALLEELGLAATGRNVVDFGRAALARLEAVAQREAGARRLIEEIARANFAAQTQTHVAALDLMEAQTHAELARHLDAVSQGRFGLAGAAVAVEKPGAVPFGWKALEAGRVDALLGEDGLHWLGPNFTGLNLFGPAEGEVASVALVRMSLHAPGEDAPRSALCAFGSAEDDGFTPAMGCELVAFVARVVERMAGRWPLQA